MAPNTAYSAIADLSVLFVPPSADSLDDSALLEAQRSLAEIRRRVDAAAAAVAGEIAHRSRRELGYEGLAQRLGARTPEALVQRVAGTSAREAHSLVRIGALMEEPAPWLSPVIAEVASGEISVGAADVIRAGLGAPNDSVTAEALERAAVTLLVESPALSVERLAARARELRNDLDLALVGDREEARRDRRYLHLIPRSDGMTRLSGLLDPESAAIVTAAYDAATSPRRGGPRFVDPDSIARAERIVADERTTEQLALDTLVDLLRLGSSADDGSLLGSTPPTVHILVTERDLRTGEGVGYLEGQRDAVSVHTVRRAACAGGAIPILFDGTQALDLGRTQRLFSPRHRTALAARDGGCRFPGCERPPSWTEAHHITEWSRGGRTDIADGILLCRHHHLLVHNNGWRVTRRGHEYFVVPPASVDAQREPIPAPSRSAAARRLAVAG
jgi:hypothetical protein